MREPKFWVGFYIFGGYVMKVGQFLERLSTREIFVLVLEILVSLCILKISNYRLNKCLKLMT